MTRVNPSIIDIAADTVVKWQTSSQFLNRLSKYMFGERCKPMSGKRGQKA